MRDVGQRYQIDMHATPLSHDSTPPRDVATTPTVDVDLRSGTYSLLGALLRRPPDRSMLDHLTGFNRPETGGDNDIATAIRMLGLAATDAHEQAVEDEYHALFIGLGRGELVPYGSWYMTGFLMEEPLSRLRTDLQRLGFARNEAVKEPEDHIAALCEVMAMMVDEDVLHQTQQAFFTSHIEPWAYRFFCDLDNAKAACLYRSVAKFGALFTTLESQYFAMQL